MSFKNDRIRRPKTPTGFFNLKLIEFFEQIQSLFPEERDIQMALEALEGAAAINPKLVLDLFYENVYKEAHEFIQNEKEEEIIALARVKINTQFNEVSPALSLFDKKWDLLDDPTRETIWKWLKVLCVLCDKARKD